MRTPKNPSTFLILIFVALLSPPWAAAEAAEHGLLLHLGQDVRPAPVLGTFIDVRVTGIVARATVTQMFSNPTGEYVEAVYVFPLPAKAAVDALRMVVGEREIEGEIRTAEEAAEVYREASEEGRKAALVEAQRPNVFTARVAQIGPGETVEIEIGMQLAVDYDLGTFRLRFPLVVAPRYAASSLLQVSPLDPPGGMLQPPVAAGEVNPTAFVVDVAAGFSVARVASRNHEIRVELLPGDHFAVTLADELAAADRDFVLEWTPEPGRTPRAVTYVQEVDGERYALLMVIPPAPDALASVRLPREAVFVVDVSGSMSGIKLEQAKEALLLALAQLQPGDRVNVLRFDDKTKALFPESRDVDANTLAAARRFVNKLAVGGGTEMLPALEKALEDPYPGSGLRQVVFVTDGQVGNEDELFRVIQKRLGRSRLFTVGIGPAPNGHFMRRAAELGRGTFTFIDEVDDVAAGMGALLRKLEAPVLRDVEVDWGDPAAEASPSRVPDLYLGEPLLVAARLGAAQSVRLAGWLLEKRLALTLPLTPTPAAGIDKLWARRRIDAILAEPEAAPADVETRVVELALRHQLVTDYTSLVTVDTLPTAPAAAPESYFMPVSPVGGGGGGGGGVEECITVTSESPLLDARNFATGVSVAQVELEKIPSARDPWAIVQQTPGVQADRIHVGGNESGIPTRAVGPGGAGDGEWRVDGVVVGDLGSAQVAYNFDAFEEFRVVTGSGDVTRAHAGVTVNSVTRRGTNTLRADAHVLRAGGGGSDDARDRVDENVDFGGAAGGPVVVDRMWAFGSHARRDAERTALDGDPGTLRAGDSAVKLNALLTSSNSVVASWTAADVADDGVAAGPRRAPEAALDLSTDADVVSIGDTHVFTSNFFVYGLYAETASSGDARSPGRGEALWDADGVLRGGGRGGDERHDTWTAESSGTYFFNTGAANHELTFGVRRRDASDAESRAWPGEASALRIDPRNLGVEGGAEYVRREAPGTATADRRSDAGWLQDTLTWSWLTAIVGARWDRQVGSGERAAIEWSDLAPRLALTATFGYYRQTALRASWGRYVQRLSSELVVGADPSAGEALLRDDALVAADGPWVIDPGLAPEWTDELLVGVEQSILPEMLVSLFYTHRERRGVHELRDLVIDPATGDVRAARAGDYVFDHFLRGTLPDGTPFEASVYSLGPGVADAGAGLLVSGDRRIVHDGVTLSLEKRLSNAWMARGHVHYGTDRWRLGPRWLAHHDPTDLVGSGDDDGALDVEAPADLDFGDRPWTQGRWSAALSAAVELFAWSPWSFDLAAGVFAREGYPLPYYAWDLASADGLPRRVQATAAVDAYRLDDVAVVDLRLAKETVLFRSLRATWTVDVLNLFDEDAGLRREVNLSGARGGALEETVVPRRLQLGVRLRWE